LLRNIPSLLDWGRTREKYGPIGPKYTPKLKLGGEKIVCYPRELESNICHNPVPTSHYSLPTLYLATCCYFFEHCHY
jgi:hypothetical protein